MDNITVAEVLAVLRIAGGEAGMTISEITEALGANAKLNVLALTEVRNRVRALLQVPQPQIEHAGNPQGDIRVRALAAIREEPCNTEEWRRAAHPTREGWYEIILLADDQAPRVHDYAWDAKEMRDKVVHYRSGEGKRPGAIFFGRKHAATPALPAARPASAALALTPATIMDSTASATRERDA